MPDLITAHEERRSRVAGWDKRRAARDLCAAGWPNNRVAALLGLGTRTVAVARLDPPGERPAEDDDEPVLETDPGIAAVDLLLADIAAAIPRLALSLLRHGTGASVDVRAVLKLVDVARAALREAEDFDPSLDRGHMVDRGHNE